MTAERRERGVTLVELLAALVISAILIVAASRIFLSGNRQFLLRTAESHRLEDLHRLKGVVQGLLKRDVDQCSGGKLSFRGGDGGMAGEKEAEALIKGHFPDLARATFRCLETDPNHTVLVEWKDWFQPRLIEYSVILKKNGKADTLTGSWIK